MHIFKIAILFFYSDLHTSGWIGGSWHWTRSRQAGKECRKQN